MIERIWRFKASRGDFMRQPVIKFEQVQWWILLIASLAGLAIFFALHLHAY